jgi:fructose/tagatose bisphosphate aldolase
MFAATFGNVHGVYKPGNVKLKPTILKDGQDALKSKYNARFDLVFHGGSGSTQEEIFETLDYGVVKMNVDTDTQYAFSRPVTDHIFKNYDGLLKVDGEVGNKKAYDPRAYLSWARRAWPSASRKPATTCARPARRCTRRNRTRRGTFRASLTEKQRPAPQGRPSLFFVTRCLLRP